MVHDELGVLSAFLAVAEERSFTRRPPVLVERRRAAFVLREVEQLDVGEVCNVLEVSRNNLGVRGGRPPSGRAGGSHGALASDRAFHHSIASLDTSVVHVVLRVP